MLSVSPYIKTLIDWEGMDKDWGGSYIFVSQRPYKGKAEASLAPGATVTLQIMQDAHDHGVDKAGRQRDNNTLEVFSATIVGCTYPLPFAKGDKVKLSGFLPDSSYYIDFSLILRFSSIEKVQQTPAQAAPATSKG